MSNAQVADKPLLRSLHELAGDTDQSVTNSLVIKNKTRKAPSTAFKPGKAPGPGRPKGSPNKLTVGLREAVELAVQPGQCHPDGFAGWLVERALGGIEDRKIFAGVVSRVIPLQVEKKSDNLVRIELGWLNGRDVGRHLSQPLPIAAQVVDIKDESASVPVIKHQSDTGSTPPEGAGQAGEGESA